MGAEHAELVALGANWLKRQGFPVVATEIDAVGCREVPDVVGFRSTCSAIVEVKASRADFLADARKPERAAGNAGLGLFRFYLASPDVIRPDDVPAGWGLLHVVGRRIMEIIKPAGNLWPPSGADNAWSRFQHDADTDAERAVLFSIARRLAAGKSI